MSDQSYYDILEVKQNASITEIKKKRKELAMKYHPDKLSTDKKEWGNDMIKKINEAYEVLSDPDKRKLYDIGGKDAVNNSGQQQGFSGGFPGGFPGFPGGFPGFPGGFDPSDLGGVFGKKSTNQKVAPIQEYINMTLEEIFMGKEFVKEINRSSCCKSCDSTGFEDKQNHVCQGCNGVGMKTELRQLGPGMYQKSQKHCSDCKGSGKDHKSPKSCKMCNGQGTVTEKYKVKINIKPGMRDNDIIEIQGEGNDSPNKNKRGNIVFIIKEQQHPLFKRGVVYNNNMNPYDLLMEIKIPLYKALCGFVHQFKHLDNTDVYIENNNIIKDGDIKIIEGKGLPYKNQNIKFGTLFVKFHIEYPDKLSEDNKKKIYELLTNTKFDHSKIFKLPKNAVSVNLVDSKEYSFDGNFDNDDNDDNNNDQEGVQCAQQ